MLKYTNFYNPKAAEPLHLSYEVRERGWGHIRLEQGQLSWESDTSVIMQDVLGNLVRGALYLVGNGGESFTTRIDPEGEVYELTATIDSVKVVDVLNGDTKFRAITPWHDFVGNVVETASTIFEEHGADGYKSIWGDRFPYEELKILETNYKRLITIEHKAVE